MIKAVINVKTNPLFAQNVFIRFIFTRKLVWLHALKITMKIMIKNYALSATQVVIPVISLKIFLDAWVAILSALSGYKVCQELVFPNVWMDFFLVRFLSSVLRAIRIFFLFFIFKLLKFVIVIVKPVLIANLKIAWSVLLKNLYSILYLTIHKEIKQGNAF